MKVWVIGGLTGIGQEVAEELTIEPQMTEVRVSGRNYDVRDYERLQEFHTRYGPFDLLVYSAGVNELAFSDKVKAARMLDLYDINVVGLIRALQVCPELRRVVVIGSDAARRPMRASAAYCASKAALEMVVKVIARERASDDFAINIVAPGMTDGTRMTAMIDDRVPELRGWSAADARNYERSQIPIQRRAEVGEIAEVVIKVLLMDTPYLNGSTIEVNGAR